MLATFVIGLREGLEAALIVGIIAAFLKQSNRTDAIRKVWAGVAAAVALCLVVGVLLQLLSLSLPQRQQEMLECVVAAVAVVMVSYMVLWMRRHSRDLKSDLQHAAGSALARGSAGALVAMAFLAVLREGFETAVFLLAAFQSALSPLQAAIGVILGVAVSVAIGYAIYRGGVKLNLSRFFRITGVVLVLVAAGLVISTLRAAYEAGWLTAGQQSLLNLSAVARPGSVQESLLTGMLGIRASLPVVEVVAYVLYAVPMLLVVLWPPRRTPSRQVLGRILVGTAGVAVVVAVLLAVLTPANPAAITGMQGPLAMQGVVTAGIDPVTGRPLDGTALTGSSEVTLAGDAAAADIRAVIDGGPTTVAGTSTLTVTGHEQLTAGTDAGEVTASATVLSGIPITAPVDASADLPAALTGEQIAALNGGRLPVGVRSGQAGEDYAVGYTDTLTPVLSVDPETGAVLGAQLRWLRTVQVTVPNRGTVTAGTVLDVTTRSTQASSAAGFAAVAVADADGDRAQVLSRVIPGLLLVFAVVLLAFGIPKLRRPKAAPQQAKPAQAAGTPEQPVGPPVQPSGERADVADPTQDPASDLAEVGPTVRSAGG